MLSPLALGAIAALIKNRILRRPPEVVEEATPFAHHDVSDDPFTAGLGFVINDAFIDPDDHYRDIGGEG